jgi:hypothetical protein
MSAILLAILTPAPGRESEFNSWYDNTHAIEALATPGLASIARYRVADVLLFPGIELPAPYITLYELDDDRPETMQSVAARLREVFLGGGDTDGRHISEVHFTDLIDMTNLSACFAVEVAARRTKAEVLGAAGAAGAGSRADG